MNGSGGGGSTWPGSRVFTLASAACAVAPNASLLIAARAVQGLGAAAVTPLALTILAAAFPAERRGAVVGIFGGIGGLAVAGGPLVGGAVTQGLDWHWIFWINVPIGVFAVAGSLLFLPARTAPRAAAGSGAARRAGCGALRGRRGPARLGPRPGRRSPAGATRSGWPDCLAGSRCSPGSSPGNGGRRRRCCRCGSSGVRAFAAANVTGFMSFGAIMSAAFLTAQYFQLGLGYSPLTAGLRMLPWTATPMIVAPVAGALADRIGTRPLLVVGLALQAAGLAWVAAARVGGARAG